MVIGEKNLCMLAAGLFLTDNDLISRRTTDRNGSAGDKPKNIGPFGAIPNNEIGECPDISAFFLVFHRIM
jgi:hypothetical protein